MTIGTMPNAAATHAVDAKYQKLRKAVEGFESYIWGSIMSSMQKSIPKSGLFGDGSKEAAFQNMLFHEYSKNMSASMKEGSLSDMIMKQLAPELRDQAAEKITSVQNKLSVSPAVASHVHAAYDVQNNMHAGHGITDSQKKQAYDALRDMFGLSSISSDYGWRDHPIHDDRRFHHGIDVPLPIGSQMKSPVAGTVIMSKYDEGYGNYVTIRSESGNSLRFAHMDRSAVNEGDKIQINDIIGLSGNTGRSTGPHVHFEVRDMEGKSISPIKYLKGLKKS